MKFLRVTLGLILGVGLAVNGMAGSPEKRVADLGLELPPAASPVANYVPSVRSGNLVFLAGHIPRDDQGELMTGKVGADVSLADGQAAARHTALALLATLRQELGSLDRVKRIVRVEGFVNCPPDFTQQSAVINGCSDLLIEIFGESGRHARMAIGAGSLPLNVSVEIAMIVEVE
jgi:enamine deaminase RidA (YjgF/YER057c/UK114 family)